MTNEQKSSKIIILLVAVILLGGSWLAYEGPYKSYRLKRYTDRYVKKVEKLQKELGKQANHKYLSKAIFSKQMGANDLMFPQFSVRFEGNLEKGRCIVTRKAVSGDKKAVGQVIYTVRDSEVTIKSGLITFSGKTVNLLKE
jgi:hypothetical protein